MPHEEQFPDLHSFLRALRDYFAGQALAGFLADGSQRLINEAVKESDEGKFVADTQALTAIVNDLLASGCYQLADAMIAERAKSQSGECP